MLISDDFKTHLYAELIKAIGRDDNGILQQAISAAESEAKGYLSRYDRDLLFAKIGDDRDPALLLFLKDMAAWHFITLANPNTDLEFRENRYQAALTWLKNIQSGKVVPENWPLPQTEGSDSFFHVGSNLKRGTHY